MAQTLTTITIRELLEETASAVFQQDGVADVVVDGQSVHIKFARMHRALVAHEALCMRLREVGVTTPLPTLLKAIDESLSLGLISCGEARWLRHFSREANCAKQPDLQS